MQLGTKLPFLIIFGSLFIVSSCGKKKSNSGSISRSDRDALIGAEKSAKSLVARLDNHFEGKGYSFNLVFESSKENSLKSDVSKIVSGNQLLMCDGIASEEDALNVDSEIRRLVGKESLKRVSILYKLKDRGYYIPADKLASYNKQQSEQVVAPDVE